MWGHILISIVVLLTSLFYHYHFSEPASIIDYPETHYDYIVGEFACRFKLIGILVSTAIPALFFFHLFLFPKIRSIDF